MYVLGKSLLRKGAAAKTAAAGAGCITLTLAALAGAAIGLARSKASSFFASAIRFSDEGVAPATPDFLAPAG